MNDSEVDIITHLQLELKSRKAIKKVVMNYKLCDQSWEHVVPCKLGDRYLFYSLLNNAVSISDHKMLELYTSME
jgi:hypothetical protein